MTFINSRGHEAVFGSGAPYVFWKIQGIELPEVTPIATQAGGQSGYTLHDVLLESRTVRLTGHVHGTAGVRDMYALRQRLCTVCNPLLGLGRLVYRNDVGAWQCPAFCVGNPYGTKMGEFQTLEVAFECPSPFWRSADPVQVGLAYVSGGLQFPIRTPGFFGTLGYRAVVDNDGDVVTPLEFHIEGGSINPIVRNVTTGEHIRLSRHLAHYDRLYVNTDPEKQEVSLVTVDPLTNQDVRENAYGYLTDDSALFKLAPGKNELTFTSDDENKRVRIRVLFYKRYAGV